MKDNPYEEEIISEDESDKPPVKMVQKPQTNYNQAQSNQQNVQNKPPNKAEVEEEDEEEED